MTSVKRTALKGAAALAVAAALAGAGIGASYSAQASADATANMGRVDIELAPIETQPEVILVTGSPVECRTEVANKEADSWIRVRVEHSISDGAIGTAAWTGGETVSGDGWMLAGDGWWYYPSIVPSGHSVPFESVMSFPVFEQALGSEGYEWHPVVGELELSNWSMPSPDPDDDPGLMAYSGAEGSRLTDRVTAEAVQARNFEPDFNSADPWGGAAADDSDARSASKEA